MLMYILGDKQNMVMRIFSNLDDVLLELLKGNRLYGVSDSFVEACRTAYQIAQAQGYKR